MSLFYMNPYEALNFGSEPEPSRHVYLIRRPRKNCDAHRQQHEVQKQQQQQEVPKDNFHVTIDVQQFTPEEISIKAVDRNIIVEAKHEEKEDQHGSVYRHFVRKYVVGEEYDLENVESHLSMDGVLRIIAPQVLDNGQKKRVIPIIQTGKLSNNTVTAEEKKKSEDEQ